MYEKILVPLDGSRVAEVALSSAEDLARRLDSRIVLLSIAESAEAQDYHKQEIYLSNIAADISKREKEQPELFQGKGLNIDSVVLVGQPAEEIIRYSNQENISLIIMSTHGHSGIKRWTLGRMTDRVLRATERPLVLVRAGNTGAGNDSKGILFHKVVISLDGSEESEAVISPIAELAARLQTEVTLLQVVARSYRVYADAEAYLETVLHLLRSKGINANSVVRMGTAANEIIKLADETKADIVAMSTHGRSGIRQWAIGSVADRVLRRGNSHVLLVRSHQTRNI